MRKLCLMKSLIFKNQQFEKCLWGVDMGIEDSKFHSCPWYILHWKFKHWTFDNTIVGFRNIISTSVASKSWTRMECGVLVPIHDPFQAVFNFYVLKMSDFTPGGALSRYAYGGVSPRNFLTSATPYHEEFCGHDLGVDRVHNIPKWIVSCFLA